MQDLRRGEEHRSQHLVHRFVRVVRALGPLPGTPVSMNLTNKAKHNQEGRNEYTGAAPHYDALRDTAAWLGLLWMWRFIILGEGFPNFLNYQELFKVPTYRSAKNAAEPISDSSYSDIWTRFFADAKVVVGMLTHMGRRQGQQEMDDAGCDPGDISRMAGHQTASVKQTRSQVEHYLTPPPVSGLSQRGDGDPKNTRAHCPSWIIASGVLLEELMELGFSELLEQQRQVHAGYDACKTHQERLDGRWCSAKASIDSMVHDIRRALQMLASRPICPDTGVLLANEPTFRSQFAQSDLFQLFRLPVFNSPKFLEFEDQMREAQDNYFATSAVLDAPVRNELARAINEQIAGPLEVIGRCTHFIRNAVESVQAFQQARVVGYGGPSFNNGSFVGGAAGPQMLPPQPPAGLLLLHPPLPAQADTLADGSTPRIRCRPTTQLTILQHENAQGLPEIRLELCDQECTSLADYWRKYTTVWRPLEWEQGEGWRNDRQTPGQKKDTKRSTWWSLRRPIFKVIEFYMNSMSEEEALSRANDLFCSVPANRTNGKRPIKKVSGAFKDKAKALNIPKTKLGRRPSRSRPNNGSAFAAAFPTT